MIATILLPSPRETQLEQEILYLKAQIAALFERIHEQDRQITELKEQLALRDARISELERRLRLNSTNSSKPPSSDFLAKPCSSPKSTAKKGAKVGHPGTTRKDFGVPDRTEDLVPETCDACGSFLKDLPLLPGHRHQVAEWVAKPIEITEYHHQQRICPCCHKRVQAPYPTDILPGSRLGPKLIAHLVLFNRWGHMSLEKLQRLLSEDFGLSITTGTIRNAFVRVHEALKTPYLLLAQSLPLCPMLNIDETGWRIEGERFNVWTFSTVSFTFLKVAKTRGHVVLDEVLGKDYGGLIICDFLATYDRYLTQRCLAHLRRDLKACLEEKDNQCRAFAAEALGYIKDAWELWKQHRQGGLSLAMLQEKGRGIVTECRKFIDTLPSSLPAPAVTLRKRFIDDWDSLWIFLSDPTVMPHNNDAERSLRPIVTLRKMSGGSQSTWGADLSAEVHTVLATCRKQGRNAHEFIVQALLAKAHSTLPMPSLLPPKT